MFRSAWSKGRVTLTLEITPAGDDLCAVLTGGESPHVGGVVISTPRPSLKGDGSISATSSVINLPGHKDGEILQFLAEKICISRETVVTASGGVHIDDISSAEIELVFEGVEQLSEQFLGSG